MELAINNAVVVVLGFVTVWWTIGGRDRRALAAIRERMDLLDRLEDKNSEFGLKLRSEIEARGLAYSRRPALWPVHASLVFIVLGGAGGAVVRHQHPDSSVSWASAVLSGTSVGMIPAMLLLLGLSIKDMRDLRRTGAMVDRGHRS